jgi:hypothetical protein
MGSCDRDLRDDEDEDFLEEDIIQPMRVSCWGVEGDGGMRASSERAKAAVCGVSEVCVV